MTRAVQCYALHKLGICDGPSRKCQSARNDKRVVRRVLLEDGEQKTLLQRQTSWHQHQPQREATLPGGFEQDEKESQESSILAEATLAVPAPLQSANRLLCTPKGKQMLSFCNRPFLLGSLLNPEPVAQLWKGIRTEIMLKYYIKGTWRNGNRSHR